jgi:hypothetical protein
MLPVASTFFIVSEEDARAANDVPRQAVSPSNLDAR